MSRTVRLRATAIQYGSPGLVIITAVDEDPANYINNATGGSALSPVGGTGGNAGSTKLLLMDSVTLRDADDGPGFYLAASGFGTAWPGAVISKSGDGGETFADIESVFQEAVMALAQTALAAPARNNDWDNVNTLTVGLLKPSFYSLVSDSDINVLNGANVAALIDSTGQVEILQWGVATALGGGRYTLSHLLRGRKGSDYAMAAHAVGDSFVVLDTNTTKRIANASADLNLARIYKATSFGTFSEDAAAVPFTNTGASLKPLSPVIGTAARDGSQNLTVNFIRRTRIGGEWLDNVDVPIGEVTEGFECDIYTTSGFTVVKRTLTNTATAAGSKIDTATHVISYKAADQTTDGFTPGNPISFRAYQLSASVGRGFPAQATV